MRLSDDIIRINITTRYYKLSGGRESYFVFMGDESESRFPSFDNLKDKLFPLAIFANNSRSMRLSVASIRSTLLFSVQTVSSSADSRSSDDRDVGAASLLDVRVQRTSA